MLTNLRHWIQTFFPLTLISLGYGLFFLGIVNNRLDPSYESALAVAYAAFIGLVFVVIGSLLALLVYRFKPKFRRHLLLASMAFIAYIIFWVLADIGKLSIM